MSSDALTRFEIVGDLYYARFHRLRPGKSDVLRDSSEPENCAQFENWLQTSAFTDAIDQIATLEEVKKNLAQLLEECAEELELVWKNIGQINPNRHAEAAKTFLLRC